MNRRNTGENLAPFLEEEKLREKLNEDSGILALFLYGSRSSGKSHPRSDTDIAMLLGNKVKEEEYNTYRMKYISELKEFFPKKLDFIILNQVPPILQFQVLKNGKLLYDPEPDRRALLEVKILNKYYLSKRFYEFHFQNLKNRIKERGLGHGQECNRSAAEEARRISEKLPDT
jgi:predicted nucleotidyltransferase